MSELTESFVRALTARFPDLGRLLAEHLAHNLGQLLPHVFFGDIVRWAVSLLISTRTGDNLTPRRELREFCDLLEETYSGGNEELQELLSVSFLENLPRPGEDGAEIRNQLGRNLAMQLRVIGVV